MNGQPEMEWNGNGMEWNGFSRSQTIEQTSEDEGGDEKENHHRGGL